MSNDTVLSRLAIRGGITCVPNREIKCWQYEEVPEYHGTKQLNKAMLITGRTTLIIRSVQYLTASFLLQQVFNINVHGQILDRSFIGILIDYKRAR